MVETKGMMSLASEHRYATSQVAGQYGGGRRYVETRPLRDMRGVSVLMMTTSQNDVGWVWPRQK